MNRLQCFALITFCRDRQYWSELVTVRSGELMARRSVFSIERGRIMAERLADRHNVPANERAGMFCGAIVRVGA